VILVDLEGVGVSRPDRPLFVGLSLTVSSGDRLGVVGINGAGKSTLLRIMAGVARPEEGEVRWGRGVRIAFGDQNPELPAGTVRNAVGTGWEAASVLERLGMGPLADADVATLSGGQAKRVALARALVAEVDLLILDEPTNHVDIAVVAWLEARLKAFRGGLVVVTHDRHVLDRVTTRIVELDRGSSYVHDGGYASYLDARALRDERSAGAETVRRNLARAELAWLRRGAPARTRKPHARVAAATALVTARPPPPARSGGLDLAAAGTGRRTTPRLGDKVIRLAGAGHRFDDGRWLFRELDLELEPDGRLGIVGANGTGKSTLLDILAGRMEPAEGRVERGPTVRIGLYDQTGRQLELAQRVREAVAGPLRQPDWEDAQLMEQFWFDADAQRAPIGTLSGGERRRLQLLLVLAERPNVLLLDEPTNDLDLDTLRVLEEFLEAWPGSLVVVSHDRAFLERTVTDLIAFEGPVASAGSAADGRVLRPAGGYSAWAATLSNLSGLSTSSASSPATRTRASRSPAPAANRPPRSRTPSTVRRLVGVAERQVAELEARRDDLAAQLVAATDDYTALARLGTELATVNQRLAAAEHRWLELATELDA
jgi:ABC transport system ATP-binding/permease protein